MDTTHACFPPQLAPDGSVVSHPLERSANVPGGAVVGRRSGEPEEPNGQHRPGDRASATAPAQALSEPLPAP